MTRLKNKLSRIHIPIFEINCPYTNSVNQQTIEIFSTKIPANFDRKRSELVLCKLAIEDSITFFTEQKPHKLFDGNAFLIINSIDIYSSVEEADYFFQKTQAPPPQNSIRLSVKNARNNHVIFINN